MKAERTHILQMVADGKITVEEAEKLLEAIEPNSPEKPLRPAVKGRFLRVKVFEEGKDKVNVTIPLALAKVGLRFAPKDSGIRDLDIDELVRLAVEEGADGKLVEVIDGDERVEVYVD
ncbi:MAG: hypothetical protein GX030_05535 [Firmicutes bacterium]|nr:hypothetical protein [Bacillota bacterium]